jgi:hypothetical protein
VVGNVDLEVPRAADQVIRSFMHSVLTFEPDTDRPFAALRRFCPLVETILPYPRGTRHARC